MTMKRILIANRGEIACRIIRACKALGLTSIAVYSEADADALFVQMADVAEPIGPAPAAQSYLDGERILAAAQKHNADAVHPGYGFLSENTAFARARHIEIQVFGHGDGSAVHLFERECSVQRRFQKIIEESPAPNLPEALRAQMTAAAVALAVHQSYRGPGTVEFIVDADTMEFFFLEMNTRIQVEHPVTEMVTGMDLVQAQIQLAAGTYQRVAQAEIQTQGAAIECRIYAENPAKHFMPSPGPLQTFRLPLDMAHVRIDTGVREGDRITPYYDPMIAKLIVWGDTRAEALERLRAALAASQIEGVRNNLGFLAVVVAHPDFQNGQVDTTWIARESEALLGAMA
jgi:3-methylcrotonyl-CoA carboxylase alpha subunit